MMGSIERGADVERDDEHTCCQGEVCGCQLS